jgi:hypothetical protein
MKCFSRMGDLRTSYSRCIVFSRVNEVGDQISSMSYAVATKRFEESLTHIFMINYQVSAKASPNVSCSSGCSV